MMKNIIDESINPSYEIKRDNFRVELFINSKKEVVVLAYKDNNYLEWLSKGQLSKEDLSVGESISFILQNTPLKTTTNRWWKSYEEFSEFERSDLYLYYYCIRIYKTENKYKFNNTVYSNNLTENEIHDIILDLYEQYVSYVAVSKNAIEIDRIKFELNSMNRELNRIFQIYDDAAYHRTEGLRETFDEILAGYRFCGDTILKKLLKSCSDLIADMYNRYMTVTR